MAFSTQKEFFHVPFMNETLEFECKKACVKLKSYESTIDDRSWSMDEVKQSKFLSDLVTCNTPVDSGSSGIGGSSVGDDLLAKYGIKGGDSVLECANQTLGTLEEILNDKNNLKKQLEVSNERLKTSTNENEKIKNILNQKFDNNLSKDFQNKIQKLASSGKISKGDENELLHIYYKFNDMNKAYEVSQAENLFLKRLVEKLSARATMDTLPVEPEQSQDIAFLQTQVNNLRKEVMLLRKMEDDKLKGRQEAQKNKAMSIQDAEKIKEILDERNSLRDKCRTFKDLEKKVRELQKKAQAADNMSDNLSANLDNQTKYIGDMEKEMQRMQKHYEDLLNKCKYREELLKCQMQELKEDLCRAHCKAQKADCLQMEIGCLRNELMKRDLALGDYDCQYKQLMYVVEELRGGSLQDLQDTQTQTCNDYVEDLAFFASATLSEITKELDKRGGDGNMFGGGGIGGGIGYGGNVIGGSKGGLVVQPTERGFKRASQMSPDECCAEVSRLQQLIMELDKEAARLKNIINAGGGGDDCEELRRRLKELENENAKLLQDALACRAENEKLVGMLKEHGVTIESIADRVGKLDDIIDDQGKKTSEMGKDLEQSLQLVKDISDMQLKNQQLTNAVNAMNTRDDQNLLDELRRRLQEALDKNALLMKENEELRNLLKSHGITPPPPLVGPGAAGTTGAGGAGAGGAGAGGAGAGGPGGAGATGGGVAGAGGRSGTGGPGAGGGGTGGGEDGDGEVGPDGLPILGVVIGDGAGGGGGGGGATGRGGAGIGGGKQGGAAGGGGSGRAGTSGRRGKGQADSGVDDFVNKNVGGMSMNLKAGNQLESELRNILDSFISECGFFFCQCTLPKSKFYALCHKILHRGINTLSFRELVYFNKKIIIASDKLNPGCLISMLMAEHCKPQCSVEKKQITEQCKPQDGVNKKQKCCNCKNVLCCSNSEEMLKDKVSKLERDIEKAKEYLDNYTTKQSSHRKSHRKCGGDDTEEQDERNTTFRAAKTQQQPQQMPKCSTKQLKQLKARILKCSDMLR